jgi:chorismate synthase
LNNSYGQLFRISTFGESHGPAIGVVIDGCPAGLDIDESFIQSELDRRKPGQSKITTQRKEDDTFKILSGVFEGKSTGTPIAIMIENQDQRSTVYATIGVAGEVLLARLLLVLLLALSQSLFSQNKELQSMHSFHRSVN